MTRMEELDMGTIFRLQFGGVLNEEEKLEVQNVVLEKISEILCRGDKHNLLERGGF